MPGCNGGNPPYATSVLGAPRRRLLVQKAASREVVLRRTRERHVQVSFGAANTRALCPGKPQLPGIDPVMVAPPPKSLTSTVVPGAATPEPVHVGDEVADPSHEPTRRARVAADVEHFGK